MGHGLLLVGCLEGCRGNGDVVVSMVERDGGVRLVSFIGHSSQVRRVLGLVAPHVFFIAIRHHDVLIESYLVSC